MISLVYRHEFGPAELNITLEEKPTEQKFIKFKIQSKDIMCDEKFPNSQYMEITMDKRSLEQLQRYLDSI